MSIEAVGQVLETLDDELKHNQFNDVKPLQVDKWLAASILQKAIRRNDVDTALRAAHSLWHQDKGSFWRRLHIISVEDVGVASVDGVTQTLFALNQSTWRRARGDLRVGLALTKRLCGSLKTRLGDEAYIIAHHAPELQSFRTEISGWNNQQLSDYVLNKKRDLLNRALCLWRLAGTKRFPSEHMDKNNGSLEAAYDVLIALGAPPALTSGCIGALTKTQWPLVLFTPLLWDGVKQNSHQTQIIENAFNKDAAHKNIPLCALDMFTRLGRSSFGEFKKEIKALKPFKINQIGLAVFYYEGGLVNQRLTSEYLDHFKQEGELVDAQSAGLDIPQYLGLKEIVSENLDLLNVIRWQKLKIYDFTADATHKG